MFILSLYLWGVAGGCDHVTPAGARYVGTEQGRVVTATEVQQDVQRFTGEYFARVSQSADAMLEHASPEQREQVLRRVLLYSSSALDIATGPVPPVNMLDMLVFLSLTQTVYDRHWLPLVFGETGRPLAEALRRSEAELWEASAKVLSPLQQEELRSLISAWLRDNPDQVRVEAVRLSDFSAKAGAAELNRKATGLLASMKSAARTADEAVLLGERAIFLAQRAPFLVRLHTRLGVHEVVSDGVARVVALQPMLDDAKALRPAIRDLSQLTVQAREAAEEARTLTEAVQPLASMLEPLLTTRTGAEGETTGLEQTVATANRLTETSISLVRELRAFAELGPADPLKKVTGEADRLVRRWFVYLLLLGLAWSILFWSGYYVAKRAVARQVTTELASGDQPS